jgi:hypothetical protein
MNEKHRYARAFGTMLRKAPVRPAKTPHGRKVTRLWLFHP